VDRPGEGRVPGPIPPSPYEDDPDEGAEAEPTPGPSAEPGRDGPQRDGPQRDGPQRDGPQRDEPERDGPERDEAPAPTARDAGPAVAPEEGTAGEAVDTDGGFGKAEPPGLPWSRQPSRWFVATEVDLGVLFATPRVQFGYGKPHHLYVGLDVNPTISLSSLGGYTGLRLRHPIVELSVGTSIVYSFRRTTLPRQASYRRDEVNLRNGPLARYTVVESELQLEIPAGTGEIITEIHGLMIVGAPQGRNLFEEGIDQVVQPPFAARFRGGYALELGERLPTRVGVVGESILLPDRGEVVWRAGLLIRIRIDYRLEIRGNFVAVLASPDPLGLNAGEFAELGLRWRWASGQPQRTQAAVETDH
jgi:hypothetical protein